MLTYIQSIQNLAGCTIKYNKLGNNKYNLFGDVDHA